MAEIGKMVNTMASIDSGAEPFILNSAWDDKVKFKRVKWMGLPVKFFDKIKCPTEARNILVKLAARQILTLAAIIECIYGS